MCQCHVICFSCCRLTTVSGCCWQEEDLLHMERTVLNSLGFRINAPTAYTFWSIFRMSHAAADETSSLALYLTVSTPAPSAARFPQYGSAAECLPETQAPPATTDSRAGLSPVASTAGIAETMSRFCHRFDHATN
jgi:hypothetical protein